MSDDRRPYYVAYDTRFSYVRGLVAARARLAEYLNTTAIEVYRLRKRRACAGFIKRVPSAEARAAGI
jgi:CRP-like cAMP-binding protein